MRQIYTEENSLLYGKPYCDDILLIIFKYTKLGRF